MTTQTEHLQLDLDPSGTAGPGWWDRLQDNLAILDRAHAVHVDAFGAVADDSTDNSVAIQAAYDSLAATGGTVEFGEGIYRFNSTITPPRKCIRTRGAGFQATFLKYMGTGIAFHYGNGVNHYDWGTLEDLEVKAGSNGDYTLVLLDGAHRGIIRNVYLRGASDGIADNRSLHLKAAYQNYFETSVFASSTIVADLDDENHDVTFKDVSMGGQTCLRVLNSHNVRVSGGQISDATNGAIHVLGTNPSKLSYGFELRDVHFEGNNIDCVIGDAAESSVVVPSPLLCSPFPAGLKLDKAEQPTVIGSLLGLYVAGTKLTITANTTYAVLVGLNESASPMISDAGVQTLRIDRGMYRIYDAGTLMVQIDKDSIRLANNKSYGLKDAGGTYRRGLGLSGGNAWNLADMEQAGYAAQLFGNPINFVLSGVSADLGAQLDDAADGQTTLLLMRNVGGTLTLQRVSMGAADSGGAGYKLLRVPN